LINERGLKIVDVKNEISVELRSLSDLVSGISRLTPYGVPDGYFDQLPTQVLNRVAAKSSTFHVPGGYFEGFAAQVLARIKTGAGNSGSTQPDTPGLIMREGVAEELVRLSAVLSRISREMPYRLPAGYFEEISPILTLLRGKPTYRAPAGYFEQLESELAPKAMQPLAKPDMSIASEAKVIPFGRRGKLVKGNWWKYSSVGAVAACLILVFSWPQLHTDVMHTNEVHQLALDLPQGLHRVSDQEIQTYLDDQNSILAEPVTNSTATLDMNEGDVKSLLADVPDGELQQYMEEHGKATDIATN
jgi:hypothetical protein